MSTEKDITDQALPGPGKADTARHADNPPRSKPLIRPKIVALEIDEEFYEGGDPYNHTGAHYVHKIRDRD